ILRRSAGDANRLRRADVGDLRFERAFAVENLDAVVAGIGDVDVPGRVAGDAADAIELTRSRSGLPPRLHEVPVLGELRDAVVRTESIGHIDVACPVPGDVRGPVERISVNPGSG